MSQAIFEQTSVTPSAPAAPRGKLRVAIIGCGEVTRQFHLPVLAGHEDVELVGLIDRDVSRAQALAREYGVRQTADDAARLVSNSFDAAVVATPPAFHAGTSIQLLRGGSHVLVEKPMATCYRDATAMVEAAEAAGKVLSVGLFRRLLPGLGLLKAAIDGGQLGRVLDFSLEGGAVYGWSAATLGNMRKELAGGGVLMDMGPHFLDQLLFLFDGPGEVVGYEDDSLGGVEADCRLDLRLHHDGESVEGRVELSRLRTLGNSLTVRCERGTLELVAGERYRVRVKPNGMNLVDPATGRAREVQLDAVWSDQPETPWYETVRAQVDDWVEAIRSGGSPRLSGRSALGAMAIIDDCYRLARRRSQPWVDHPLCHAERHAPPSHNGSSAANVARRVLVTGASGFIGCRVAEILSRRAGYRVRALVHDPAHASRVARLDAELVQGDLTNADDVRSVMDGCDAVVHCAVGTAYGNRKEIFRVSVGGTENLLEAAIAAKASRFVHLSSIAVHGDDARGVIDESTPLRPGRGDYSASKAEAERRVLAAVGRGLPAVVFRPGCVYGPYGATFTTRPIEHLLAGRLVLRGSCDTPSNTVYVDNLVEAIVRSLEAEAGIAGEVFALADDDRMTWGEFYGYFAEALGGRLRIEAEGQTARAAAGRGWWNSAVEIARSDEFKQLAKKALYTDPLGRLPRKLIEASPTVKQWLRRRLGMNRPAIYTRAAADEGDVLEITPRHAEVKSDRARMRLGYEPMLSRSEALQRTLQWIKAFGIS
ncbi:MAG TPA: NAD-dependent epimerase/dehydratase family protein [Pirellulales bacterium]|nr:NAD-dependent epimerase/dehydratase family protein [Pirellulales bacterium]